MKYNGVRNVSCHLKDKLEKVYVGKDKLNYIEQPIPPALVVPPGQHVAPEILAAHNAWIKGSKKIAGLMLMTMEPEIQRNLEILHAHEMLLELKTLFAQQAEQELLQTTRDFHSCKQEEESVSSNLMVLPKNNALALYAIRAGKVQKVNKHKKWQPRMAARGQNHRKGKNKKTYAPKPKILPPPKRKHPAKDSICHECGETGHWKRNCPQYLAELLKKKKNEASGAGGSGIFVKELYTILNRSWNYDTDCGTHICNTTQGLRASRKLKPEDLSLYVGNGQREAVEAIGIFYLCLPSGLVIVLNNCHYAPSITRGVISVSCLYEDGFINRFVNNTIQVSRNNMGFEKCVSCMSGKMARKPFTHQVEMAKDLLRLIHTDVCGPFKILSRQEASYSVTFTDDFRRYGYVYLLKHKHEVFETFKVFQKKVENQLGKTIKSLRSNRGGEYRSQEFLNHLKDHRIIAHRTPLYTPQHNGVSERRNRTLLDMVRSMMSQTTLPKSFWDYALKTAVRILNMVPTKKVEKTPYENKVLVARNAEFLENSLITQEASRNLEDLEIIQEEDTHPSIDTSLNHEEDDLEIDEPQSDIVPIHRSTRTRQALDPMCLYIDAEEHGLGDMGEPANYKAALLDHESEKWLNAMNVQIQSMKDNKVWVLVELPPNGKTVGSKWLFKKKTDMDGVLHTYKARLVVKGYTQTSGIDYEETFSPVADIRAIRILMAIAACFAMKDLGEAAYILGIKIYRDRSQRLIGLCQSAYTKKILKRYCMENSKRGSIPMQEKLKLSKSQGASTLAELKRIKNVPYASDVGSIMYAVRCTRPDVVFTQNVKSRFQHNPELKVSCYTDAGYLADADDLKSQTGYVFVLNDGVVDWRSAKQSIFATSSAKAEYIAAFDASKEAVWVRKFIYGLGVVPTIEEPITMYCDNAGAIAIANESGITKGARQIHAKFHYLREVIEYGDVKLEKVHTDDNLADPFTKALAFPKHLEHTRNIGMPPASSLM
nr:putative retrotransposon protein [Tanacetum cinerariifolium]